MHAQVPVHSAYYSASLDSFPSVDVAQVVGQLVLESEFSIEPEQRDAWQSEVDILKQALAGICGTVLFEYIVPRIGSRIDAVVITGPAVVVIEFKIGARRFERADENQVWDYALDLKNFHLGSREALILPILVASDGPDQPLNLSTPDLDRVYPALLISNVMRRVPTRLPPPLEPA